MDESQFVKLRVQMEESNQDVQDFLRDMDQWRSSVDRKKADLRTIDKTMDLPQIRNVLHRKKKKKRENGDKSKSLNKKQVRIKSCDYDAWGKFNADKAVEAVDIPKDGQSSGDSETDEDWENERRIKLSEVEKEQGNLSFREGKYTEAVEHYTTAIRMAPENPLLYSNRALALCKLKRFATAEADCSTALTLDPHLVKALYRRAQARKALAKVNEAVNDLKRILDIDSSNSAALKDLSSWTGDSNLRAGGVNSVFKLIDISKLDSKRLRRIPIAEVGGSKATRAPVSQKIELAKSGPSLARSAAEGDGAPKRTAQSRVTSPLVTPKNPPTNWFQLEREMRELVPSGMSITPAAVDYLCSIEPANYASVIGANLNSSCLGHLLTAFSLNSNLTGAQKAERMTELGKLPRFDVAWMLAEDADRKTAESILRDIPPDVVGSLEKRFS